MFGQGRRGGRQGDVRPLDSGRFFQTLADRFIEGDLRTAVTFYSHPLVVYGPQGIRIEKTPDDTIRTLAGRLMDVRSGGAESVLVTIDSIGRTQNRRQPFDATWTFLDADGVPVGQSRFRYFCRHIGPDLKIELMEIMQVFQTLATSQATFVSH